MRQIEENAVAVPVPDSGDAIALQTLNVTIGTIETNAKEVLAAVRKRIEGYRDIEKYVGHTDIAKNDRAFLRKQKDLVKTEAKNIATKWNAPLEQFNAIVKEIITEFDCAVDDIDGLVKAVEEREKQGKRLLIERSFESRKFDLVPLERIFNPKWLNKTCKMNEVEAEMDKIISDIYANIKVLENIPEHGMTVKSVYLDTLDMGAAMRQVESMKKNAERLAREKAERQKRELEAQVERNRRELRKEERDERRDAEPSILIPEPVGFAEPELPEEPKGEEILEFCCRFRGTRENLKAMREWMSAHNIAYEKLEEEK